MHVAVCSPQLEFTATHQCNGDSGAPPPPQQWAATMAAAPNNKILPYFHVSIRLNGQAVDVCVTHSLEEARSIEDLVRFICAQQREREGIFVGSEVAAAGKV